VGRERVRDQRGVKLFVFGACGAGIVEARTGGTVLNAKSAASTNEVVKGADIVFTMLSTPEVVEAMFLQENGALSAMKANAIWVDCSTVNPSFSLKANEAAKKAGVRFMDAPVTGTKPHAANAELAFYVGAEKALLSEVEPYFNMMLAQSMIVFSEALLLGEKMGMDKEFLLEMLPKTPVVAPFVQFKREMIRSGNYEANFPLELMHKDLHLAVVTAYEMNHPLYLANLAKEIFADAKKSGMGRLDFAAIHQFLEEK
jgi:3-hydroxyisobutyrate dehydrogenase-like beta-hydroxyacid dehydrogenase